MESEDQRRTTLRFNGRRCAPPLIAEPFRSANERKTSMKPQALSILFALAVALCGSEPGVAQPGQDVLATIKAKELFAAYDRLEHEFDPAIADLYADDAVIRNKRVYPTGEVREMTIPASKYKELLRTATPLAKARGDVSTYSNVTYTPEADGVRIKADRYSELKKYHSPLSLLVKPSASGKWLIYEELSESRP